MFNCSFYSFSVLQEAVQCYSDRATTCSHSSVKSVFRKSDGSPSDLVSSVTNSVCSGGLVVCKIRISQI